MSGRREDGTITRRAWSSRPARSGLNRYDALCEPSPRHAQRVVFASAVDRVANERIGKPLDPACIRTVVQRYVGQA